MKTMSADKFNWTDEQYRAIGEHGRNVLVAASAGTGKTAVLSARCVDILARDPQCNIDNILLVTFTEAAAEQMQRRIARQLKSRIRDTRDYKLARSLRRQLLLLQTADISTFHSFCSKLLKRNFYRLGIDPDFSVISEDEQMLLKSELLEKTVDWAWGQDNLNTLMKQVLDKRDTRLDEGFLGNVVTISDFLDNVISRQRWLEKALQVNSNFSEDNELWRRQFRFASDKIEEALGRFDYAVKLYRRFGGNNLPQDNLDTDIIEPAQKALRAVKDNDYDEFARTLDDFAASKHTVKTPKDIEDDKAAMVKDTIRRGVDILEKDLQDFAILNPDYLRRLTGRVDGSVRLLVELVRKFDSLYAKAKQHLKCLDFSDLEHKALQVLTDPQRFPDELVPSRTAEELKKQYRYIFVDEYQDINSVQQSILRMICREKGLFSVGDVKQSIYAFRGARPDIFIEQLRQAGSDDDKNQSVRIDLSENFRSSRNLLDFVNKIFTKLVSEQTAGFDYDRTACLLPGSDHQKRDSHPDSVELNILDEDAETSSHKFSKRWYEVASIVERIKRMTGEDGGAGETIFDKDTGGNRKIDYGDIAVLLRSPSKRVNDYVQLFRLAGIPVVCPGSTGFMEAVEISDCLSLLKVLDNPLRDIEFAAVLRSPFFNITEDRLAEISFLKNSQSAAGFYDCVCEYAQKGDDKELAGRLRDILTRLQNWRGDSVKMNLPDLLWKILRETGYLAYVSGLVNGNQRKANLLYLHDKAVEFAGFSGSQNYRRLSRFVEFIEKLEQYGRDWKSAEPEGSSRNAVRIMSIHKSKGLEFPVVILAELGGQFNRNNNRSDCILDEQQTLGVKVITPDERAKVDSLGYQVIAQRKKESDLREQMRILYVAMTRPEQKLLLFGLQKAGTARDVIYKGAFCGDETIPSWQIYSCSSLLQWILYGLSDSGKLNKLFETGLNPQSDGDELFSATLYSERDFDRLDALIKELKGTRERGDGESKTGTAPDNRTKEKFNRIKQSLEWEYPRLEYSKIDAKSSVTELTHAGDEYYRADLENSLTKKPFVIEHDDITGRPAGKVFGTAVHLLLAEVDLQDGITLAKLRDEKDRLVSEGLIDKGVADLINEESLKAFFDTEPGRKIFEPASRIFREWKFTFALPAEKWAQITERKELRYALRPDEESVIVQGVIDLLIDTPDGLVVVDFKTDNVSPAQAGHRSEKYKTQLELYASAARTVMNRECGWKYLYFINPARLIKL